MVLIRILVLKTLTFNVKLKVKHIPGKLNNYSDWLSRLEYKKFKQQAKSENRVFNNAHSPIPDELYPMEKIWLTKNYKTAQQKELEISSRKQKK